MRPAPQVSRHGAAITRLIIALALLFPTPATAAENTCFGTVANGRLEDGVALPSSGPNFSSYSAAAQLVGRTYVHSTTNVGGFHGPGGGRVRQVGAPSHQPANRFGYDLEFDAAGRHGALTIDFPAVAEHLYPLDVAARARGVGIALLIFERAYLPRLFATARKAVSRAESEVHERQAMGAAR